MSDPNTSAVFISYSTKDRDFVEREIVDILYTNGISHWFAGRHVESGSLWQSAIHEALTACPWFLVVLSKSSVDSDWVRGELDWATKNRWPDHIIPVIMEDCDTEKLHLWLPQIQAIRFTDSDSFRERLLHRFRVDSVPTVPTIIPRPTDTSSEVVRSPVFHFGGVVPPKCFIGRKAELSKAELLIEAGHNFLLVGQHRDGKTSLVKMLIHRMEKSKDRKVLAVYLNVQMWPDLTIETFLEHTILGMVGEISRQVFKCKYTSLNTWIRSGIPEHMKSDKDFSSFLEIYQHLRERTYVQGDIKPAPFQADEFLHVHSDLLEIVQAKEWQSCVVFYDEANRLPRELSIDRLMSHEEALAVPGRMSVYAASPAMAETFKQLRKSFVHEVHLSPFNRNDIRNLLACYYYGDTSRVDLPVTAEALSQLVDFSQGSPYMVQLIAGNAFRIANEQCDHELNGEHVASAYQSINEEFLT